MENNGATVIDTPDGIEFVRLLSMIGRLKIEVGTGMRSQVSILKAAQRLYGLGNVKNKRDMLATLENVRDMVKAGDVLYPAGDGTIGLYDRAELSAELASRGLTA